MKYSTWYHQYIAYPIQALEAAAVLQEYTLTDWGTWLTVDPKVQQKLKIFKKGTDGSYDPLLLPAHLLLSAHSKNTAKAKDFAEWLVGSEGQAVVAKFKKNDTEMYSIAPKFG